MKNGSHPVSGIIQQFGFTELHDVIDELDKLDACELLSQLDSLNLPTESNIATSQQELSAINDAFTDYDDRMSAIIHRDVHKYVDTLDDPRRVDEMRRDANDFLVDVTTTQGKLTDIIATYSEILKTIDHNVNRHLRRVINELHGVID